MDPQTRCQLHSTQIDWASQLIVFLAASSSPGPRQPPSPHFAVTRRCLIGRRSTVSLSLPVPRYDQAKGTPRAAPTNGAGLRGLQETEAKGKSTIRLSAIVIPFPVFFPCLFSFFVKNFYNGRYICMIKTLLVLVRCPGTPCLGQFPERLQPPSCSSL